MPPNHSVWYARIMSARDELQRRIRNGEDLSLLTADEGHVAVLVVAGNTYRETATQLSISLNDVKAHVSNVFRKLDIGDPGGEPTGVREPRRPRRPEGGSTMTVEPFEG